MRRLFFALLLVLPLNVNAGVIYHSAAAFVEASKDLPEVIAYSTSACPPCEKAKRELSEAKDLPFRVVWRKEAPPWVQAYPTFHWHVRGDDYRQRDKWDGVDVFVEMWRKSRSEPKKAGAETRPFETAQHDRPSSRAVARNGLSYHSGHNCPSCGRTQYNIADNNGPETRTHIHRCNSCGVRWWHRDQ